MEELGARHCVHIKKPTQNKETRPPPQNNQKTQHELKTWYLVPIWKNLKSHVLVFFFLYCSSSLLYLSPCPIPVLLLWSYWILSSTFPLIFKETFQHVNLNSWYHHHYSQVDHGPEIHSVKVAFLYISVTSLKCSEQSLNLDTFA